MRTYLWVTREMDEYLKAAGLLNHLNASAYLKSLIYRYADALQAPLRDTPDPKPVLVSVACDRNIIQRNAQRLNTTASALLRHLILVDLDEALAESL